MMWAADHIANGIIEVQVSRRTELLRSEGERSGDFIDKMP